jgi:hypothetical protein
MADGFPIYGPRGKDGALLQSCTLAGKTYGTSSVCVDPCNGAGSVNGGSDWVSDGYTYRYARPRWLALFGQGMPLLGCRFKGLHCLAKGCHCWDVASNPPPNRVVFAAIALL